MNRYCVRNLAFLPLIQTAGQLPESKTKCDITSQRPSELYLIPVRMQIYYNFRTKHFIMNRLQSEKPSTSYNNIKPVSITRTVGSTSDVTSACV